MEHNALITLGTFICESGNIIVSDPQNEQTDWWVIAIIGNVRIGQWNARLAPYTRTIEGKDLDYVSKLVAVHDSVDEQTEAGLKLVKVKKPIGIDSCRAGFFDLATYRSNPVEFESRCREMVYLNSAGIFPNGVVSGSGDGDGSYTLYTACDAEGKVVKLVLDFYEFYDDEDGDNANAAG